MNPLDVLCPIEWREAQRLYETLTRFWANVRKESAEGCWLWTAPLKDSGYGQFMIDKKNLYAHRLAYELLVGPIPPGLVIDHLCRVQRCLNPLHLEVVSQTENKLRGIGPTAANKRKTHCKRGHELSGENVIHRGNGRRECRTCCRLRDRKRTPRQRMSA